MERKNRSGQDSSKLLSKMDDGAGKSISDLMNECDNFFQDMGSNRQI
jgi:hypothetical protein